MRINMDNVFIGTIKVCTKYETHTTFSSKIYIGDDLIDEDCFGYIESDSIVSKKNAKLLRVTDGGYVDLDLLNSFLDEMKVKSKMTKDGGFYYGGLIIGTSARGKGSLFVDESSLIEYKPLEQVKKPTVKKLKKVMLRDVRVPGGIEW